MAQSETQSSKEGLLAQLASEIAEIKKDVFELRLDVSILKLDVFELKETISKNESSKNIKNKKPSYPITYFLLEIILKNRYERQKAFIIYISPPQLPILLISLLVRSIMNFDIL